MELVVKCLARDLYADAQDDLDINTILFEGRVQDSEMPLTRLLDRVVLLVLRCHDLIQVDFVVQKVVVLQTSEGLQHFLDLAAKVLNKGFVLDAEYAFL